MAKAFFMMRRSLFKPRFWDYQDAAGSENGHFSFRRKWIMIVAFTLVVALTPLLGMIWVSDYLTRQTLSSQDQDILLRMVSSACQGISTALDRGLESLRFIAGDPSMTRLTDPEQLSDTLSRLQNSGARFSALTVINADGAVLAHAGANPPVSMTDAEIAQTAKNGMFVGEITAGNETPPCLRIAISQNLDTGAFFVLEGCLDARVIDDILGKMSLDADDDAFIVNLHGTLQTASRNFGSRFSPVPSTLPLNGEMPRVVHLGDEDNRELMAGIAPIPEGPFFLVVVQSDAGMMSHLWLTPGMPLIGFLIIAIFVILALVLVGATVLVNRLHSADQKRIRTLHQIEYVNKLASVGRLASGVAHEINNPLAIISQKVGLIKDLFLLHPDWAGDDRVMGMMDDVLDSVRRGGDITRRLLDFACHMESAIEMVDIGATLHQILGLMEKEVERRGIAASVAVQGQIPPVEGDRGGLQQIFFNLINNAVSAMENGGRLDIIVDLKTDDRVRVRLTDTGRGIAEEDQKRIFEPFFSVGPSHGRTGLGLSITYGLVMKMGGKIKFTSRLNEGSCFTVILPVKASPSRSMSQDTTLSANPFMEEDRK